MIWVVRDSLKKKQKNLKLNRNEKTKIHTRNFMPQKGFSKAVHCWPQDYSTQPEPCLDQGEHSKAPEIASKTSLKDEDPKTKNREKQIEEKIRASEYNFYFSVVKGSRQIRNLGSAIWFSKLLVGLSHN